MQRLKSHLSYANIAATLALVIAIAGGTTAIAGSKAAKNSVVSSSIKPFNVTARDLAGIRVVQSDGQFSAFAACAKKERLLGGGGSPIPSGGPLGASRPAGNGWLVQQGRGPQDELVAAYALCLKSKPGK
ncbi:MAG TPA: hypothetical protein VH438_06000 [Gemmatimonadales bacterium]|jgi:hypothetical protein